MYRESLCRSSTPLDEDEVDETTTSSSSTHNGSRSSSTAPMARSRSEESSSSCQMHLASLMNNEYYGKRKYSMVKFGYHVAVPLARRSGANQTSSVNSSYATPTVIALVGLPARGKTFISRKLSRYLNWIGINTKVFNLGEYRRKMVPSYDNHAFFDPQNDQGIRLRERACDQALADAIHWLKTEEGEVAVFDATNTTRKRREKLYERLVTQNGFNLFFVESICERRDIIESNIREVKILSPDYVNSSVDDVVQDFMQRIHHYEAQYETLDEKLEDNFSFLKIFNAGEKVLVHKHEGHIQSRIVYYLMNIHITPRTIYLTRHGETSGNVEGAIGGDSNLTTRGVRYAKLLAEYVKTLDHPKLKIWTSWLRRTIQTATYIDGVQERWKALNELDVGECDGMTYAEIKAAFPMDFLARDADKYGFRYRRGESYEDLIARLEPVIMEMERQDSVLVIAHQAVIRCLLGYYLELSEEALPWTDVPLHTVIRLEPIAYGCKVSYIKFPVDCVTTHRAKPDIPGSLDSGTCFKDEKRDIACNSNVDGSNILEHLSITDHITIREDSPDGSGQSGGG